MSKRLTREQVVYIRSNPDNLTKKEMCEKMNLSDRCIYHVRNYATYKDIGVVDIVPYHPSRRVIDDKDVLFIKENCNRLTCSQIARILNINSSVVNYYFKKYTTINDSENSPKHKRVARKLTEEDVLSIIENTDKLSKDELARIYKVSVYTICMIQKRGSWQYVDQDNANMSYDMCLSDKEKKYIVDNPDNLSAKEIANKLKISVYTVYNNGYESKSKHILRKHKLTDEDVQLIQSNPNNLSAKEIADKFNVSIATIYNNGYVSKLKHKLTNEDVEFIQSNPNDLSARELSEKLNVSVFAIYNNGYATKPYKAHHILTDEEVKIIQNNPDKLSAKELAKKLNVNVVTVYANGYAAKPYKVHHKLTDEDVQLIQSNPNKLSVKELAKKFNVGVATIYNKIRSVDKQ